MATVASQVSDKILCAGGCGNSYTKATFDKYGGICGRCFAKKTNGLVSEPTPNIPNVMSAPVPSPIVSSLTPTVSLTPTLSVPHVFPASHMVDHLSVPMANMALTTDSKSLPVQTLTYTARLENWAESLKKANPNNIKVIAAIGAVVVSLGTAADHKRMDAVPNIHALPLEKAWNLDLNKYM